MSGRLCTTCMEWEKYEDFDICLGCLEQEEQEQADSLGTSVRLIVENSQRDDILCALRKLPSSKHALKRLIMKVDKAGTTGENQLVCDNDGHVFAIAPESVQEFRDAMQDDDSAKWEAMMEKHCTEFVGQFTDLINNTKDQPLLESVRTEHTRR